MFRVENPEVALHEEGHGIPEGGEDNGGIEWSLNIVARGDDGKQYWIDYGMVGYPGLNVLAGMPEPIDICFLQVREETGKVYQLRNSIFKVADFPQIDPITFQAHPEGSISINKTNSQVGVELGHSRIVCKDNGSWEYSLNDKEKNITAEIVHTA